MPMSAAVLFVVVESACMFEDDEMPWRNCWDTLRRYPGSNFVRSLYDGVHGELIKLKGFEGTLVKAVSNNETRCERRARWALR